MNKNELGRRVLLCQEGLENFAPLWTLMRQANKKTKQNKNVRPPCRDMLLRGFVWWNPDHPLPKTLTASLTHYTSLGIASNLNDTTLCKYIRKI